MDTFGFLDSLREITRQMEMLDALFKHVPRGMRGQMELYARRKTEASFP